MRYIKVFEEFESIDSLCQKYGIENYTVVDGLVNVDGDVDLKDKSLTKIPIKFGRVSGGFYCNSNKLVSLEGAPNSVGSDFDCHSNKLASLEGAPNSVGGDFYCHNGKLVSLEGAPQTVGGNFDCDGNKLVSLEGAPQSVGGDFYCSYNKLVSLEGAPQIVGGTFYFDGNTVKEIWKLFADKSKIDLLNYYDPIRLPENEGELPTIIIDRLNQFLEDIGKEPVEEIKGYNCV
jgi:hypothetical protein